VDCCFAAELESHLLTASHDAAKLQAPITMDSSTGGEILLMMSGEPKQIPANDMKMSDALGVVCTIIYGQDLRTPVTAETKRVLYVTYAPVGISRAAVLAHHARLVNNVRLFAPAAAVTQMDVVTADG
jgi:DNA/RNA-binding domain of Phe-tRNA-synthetase-like protein